MSSAQATLTTVDEATQNHVRETVRLEIQRRDLTMEEVAAALDDPQVTVNVLWNMFGRKPRTDVRFAVVDQLRKLWGKPTNWPYAGSAVNEPRTSHSPLTATVEIPNVDGTGSIPVGFDLDPECTRAWVAPADDDSLLPDILPGDVVLVQPSTKTVVGLAYLVERDGHTTVRALELANNEVVLRAPNPVCPDEDRQARLLGIVTGILHPDGLGWTNRLNPLGLRLSLHR